MSARLKDLYDSEIKNNYILSCLVKMLTKFLS